LQNNYSSQAHFEICLNATNVYVFPTSLFRDVEFSTLPNISLQHRHSSNKPGSSDGPRKL